MRPLISAIALLCAVQQPPVPASGAEPGGGTQLEAILDAWRLRTEACESLRYDWTEELTEHTATLLQMTVFAPAFVQPQEFAEEYLIHDIERAVQLGPEGFWHRRHGIEWNSGILRLLESTVWAFHDGHESTSVFIHPDATHIVPELTPAIAFVGNRDSGRNHHIDPVMLHHCPFEERFSPIDASSLKLVGERREIHGRLCLKLTDGQYVYWVDEESPFLIRRYERPRAKAASPPFSLRVDLEYQQNADGAWILRGWHILRFFSRLDGPDLMATADVHKAAHNVGGESMEKLRTLPAGTKVQDRRGDELKQYLVLDNGKKRPITEDDTKYGTLTYEELRTSEPGEAMPADFAELYEKLRGIGATTPAERDVLLTDLKAYLAAREPRLRHVDLLKITARRLFRSEDPQAAIHMCRDFAGVSDVYARVLLPMAEQFEGERRRQALPGSELVLTGRTVDAKEFDWSSYRGKVVLVDFWYTGCPPCLEEMPQIKDLYMKYRDAGFDVVGISSDANKETLQAYLAEAAIPWTNIHEPISGASSNARRYNIRAWPTAILVDRDGKVVSLEARGEELERLLEELLGGE